jgi:hypothetical protein
LIIAAGVPRQSRSQISTGFGAHHNAFFADDLGAGRFELYAKTPIEKWRKSQEVDTESVCFLPFVKSKSARKNSLLDRRGRERLCGINGFKKHHTFYFITAAKL